MNALPARNVVVAEDAGRSALLREELIRRLYFSVEENNRLRRENQRRVHTCDWLSIDALLHKEAAPLQEELICRLYFAIEENNRLRRENQRLRHTCDWLGIDAQRIACDNNSVDD